MRAQEIRWELARYDLALAMLGRSLEYKDRPLAGVYIENELIESRANHLREDRSFERAFRCVNNVIMQAAAGLPSRKQFAGRFLN